MDPAGPESIVFVYIFPQFLPNKDGSGILQLGRHYNLACLSVANNTNTRDRIVGNGHILQWDLMSKIKILRS